MFLATPCECKAGGSQWDPWTMDRSPGFVEAATEEMCKTLSTAHLGFPPYNLSTSALYQRPGNTSNTTCTDHPENCQNALATVTANRGMGSPPCPIGYRVFSKSECMIALRMAVKDCDELHKDEGWGWGGAGGSAHYNCMVYSLDLAPMAHNESAALFTKMMKELAQNQTGLPLLNDNSTIPMVSINSTVSVANATLNGTDLLGLNITANTTMNETTATSGAERRRAIRPRLGSLKIPRLPYRW